MFIGNFNRTTDIDLCNGELPGSKLWDAVLCDRTPESVHEDQSLRVAIFGMFYNPQTDAQTVATLYREQGAAALARLDGSFTMMIFDGDRTILIRDHHGTAAQIYYNESYFASSLSLLQKTPGCSTTVNSHSLGSFLSVGYISTPDSSFRGVCKLAAGSMLLYVNGKFTTTNLFDTSHISPASGVRDLEEISQQYAELHRLAIQRRIGQCRNVGILLSGGYDSGCNLAALRQIYTGDIRSYSIGFEGDNWSELPLAQCMSDRFGTIHHQYQINGSEILDLPLIVRELGDPFVEGGLMVNYAAMRMIGTPKPDVILGGDGSDQYFGTSARELAIHFLAARNGIKPALTALHSILSQDLFDGNNLPYRMRFHLSKILNILQGDMFGFEPFKLKKLLAHSSSIPKTNRVKIDTRSFEHLYVQHTYQSDIDKIINQVILFKASRMADLFGNRMAFPYMDLDLYNFLEQLPVAYKCKGESALKIAKGEMTAKFLLKHHYKPMLPDEITGKKKQGGFAPMPIFFKDRVQRERIAEFILTSSVTDELLNRKYVEQFIKSYDTSTSDPRAWFWYKQNLAIQYFNLLTLSIWWEQYVKLNPSVTL